MVERARLESECAVCSRTEGSNPSLSANLENNSFKVVPVGSLATTGCEPRQARKGAAATADSCAEVSLAGAATISEDS